MPGVPTCRCRSRLPRPLRRLRVTWNSEGYRPGRLLRAFAEADRVHVVGAVATVEIDVRVREHPLRALPAWHDPRVHHPKRVTHELSVHSIALRLRHTAVGRERDADLAVVVVLDAEVRVPVPVIVRPREPFGWVQLEGAVHETHDA